MTRATTPRRLRSARTALVALACAAALAAGAIGYSLSLQLSMAEIDRRGDRLLELVSESMTSELERAAALPAAFSQFRELTEIDLGEDLRPLNALLRRIVEESGLRDLYVLDYLGVARAAGSAEMEESVVGLRLGFRPYYFEALLLGRGAYHGYGEIAGERGFYFSRVFRSTATGTRFVLVARIEATRFEQAWADSNIALVDPNGVVFLASDPRLHFSSFAPVAADARERFAQSRQYDRAEITTLPPAEETIIGEARLLDLSAPEWRARGFDFDEAVLVERRLNSEEAGLDGFRLLTLLNTAEARAAALSTAIASGLTLMMLTLAVGVLAQRRRTMIEQLRREEEAKLELERRVAERTAALTASNEELQREAEERRAASAALARAQQDLAQAQKLAALGRLSTNISHEVNQPLAAIRAYAENAEAFLEREKPDKAAGNLGRIRAMTDRISRIIANLRIFARGEAPPPRPVILSDALSDALQTSGPRLVENDVQLERLGADWDKVALFGRVRLAQVFSNLLDNAIEAMSEAPERRIMARAVLDDDWLLVTLRDSGPGLSPDITDTLFDPFVTTKQMEAGPGLGLGLSIVYGLVASAGGALAARNHPEGGAEFTLRLRRVSTDVDRVLETVQEGA